MKALENILDNLQESNKILALGDLIVDIVLYVHNYPKKGKESLINFMDVRGGGSSTNFAIAIHKIGYQATVIGKIGNDVYGKILIKKLQNEGISTNKIIIDKAFNTSIVVAIVNGKGERTMLSYRSADIQLKPDEVLEEINKAYRHMHFTGYGLMFNPEKTACIKALKFAKKNGLTISFDASPMISKIDSCTLKEVFKNIDILFANEIEIKSIVGNKGIIEGIKKLIKKYMSIVVVKMGKKGALIVNEDKVFKVKAPSIQVIDKVGAGDIFDACFIGSWLKGFRIELCGVYGVAASALKIQQKGSWESFPDLNKIEKFIGENSIWKRFFK